MSDSTHDFHTGPIKTPKQLLITVVASFLVPVAVIIGLVMYVSSDTLPSGSSQADQYALGGVTAADRKRGVEDRIRKVGTVEVRDANRPLHSGEEVFKAQCTACHSTGAAGAPKIGDTAAWAARLKSGFDALVNSALHGKGAMPAQGGGDFADTEIARAVAYMANASGGKFAEPAAPAAPVADASAPAQAPAAPAPVVAAAPAAATAPAAAAAPAAPQAAVAAGQGEAIYKQSCAVCHGSGIAGAPKFGDKAAWAPRIAQGMTTLHNSALHGKGAMPPKGGSTAPDADIMAAVDYMVNASK